MKHKVLTYSKNQNIPEAMPARIMEQNKGVMDLLAGQNKLDEMHFQIYAAREGLMI